jgi:hypothetical protein
MKKILLSLLIILMACQPSGKNEMGKVSIQSVVKEKFSGPVKFVDNKNNLYTLCYNQQPSANLNPQQPLHFLLFDNQKNEVIYEDNLPNGSVKWIGKYQIKVEVIPGIVSIEQENIAHFYIYDVQLKKKIKNQ